MKKAIGIGLVGVAAFGAALAAGWWMNQPADERGQGQTASEERSDREHNTDEADAPVNTHNSHDEQISRDSEAEVPLPVRPRAISPEEIFQIGMNLREREAAVAEREQYLESRQDQLNLIRGELEREQQEIEGLRAEVRSLLLSGEDLIQQLNAAQQTITQQEAALQALRTQAEQSGTTQVAASQENLRRIADIFQGMEPEQAAKQLENMANGGDIDFVIQVYAQLEDRDAAAIGEHITDQMLFTEIITGLRNYENPVSTAPALR